MIIVQTPLRISLLGGGTDFYDYYHQSGGAVLSTAIDKYLSVIVQGRFDDKIVINYSKKEIVDSIDEIQHDLVREAMRLTAVSSGVEITTLSDVPSEGSGLGSSSSVTVGLLHAFYVYQGVLVSADELARQACHIEIDILGEPIGKQDQYIAAYGGMRFISFEQDESVQLESIVKSDEVRRRISEPLMLFYTNVTRRASSVLKEQQENIPQSTDLLQSLKTLAVDARNRVMEGDYDALGSLMHSGWELKKQLSSTITNNEINEMYLAARGAGALGGKIVGAGGGGFLLLYCQPSRQDDVRSVLHHLRELPFTLERDGSKVIFDNRR